MRRILVVGPRILDRLVVEAGEHFVEHPRHLDRVRQHETPAVGGHEQPRVPASRLASTLLMRPPVSHAML